MYEILMLILVFTVGLLVERRFDITVTIEKTLVRIYKQKKKKTGEKQ